MKIDFLGRNRGAQYKRREEDKEKKRKGKWSTKKKRGHDLDDKKRNMGIYRVMTEANRPLNQYRQAGLLDIGR